MANKLHAEHDVPNDTGFRHWSHMWIYWEESDASDCMMVNLLRTFDSVANRNLDVMFV